MGDLKKPKGNRKRKRKEKKERRQQRKELKTPVRGHQMPSDTPSPFLLGGRRRTKVTSPLGGI